MISRALGATSQISFGMSVSTAVIPLGTYIFIESVVFVVVFWAALLVASIKIMKKLDIEFVHRMPGIFVFVLINFVFFSVTLIGGMNAFESGVVILSEHVVYSVVGVAIVTSLLSLIYPGKGVDEV